MQSLSLSGQISSRELSVMYSRSTEYSQTNKTSLETQPTKAVTSDKLDISPALLELQDLGLKLDYTNIIEDSSNLKFQYNFSNSIFQVQSSGNYNIYANKGSLNLSINISSILSKNEADKISILPKEVKIKLDFSLSEVHDKKEKGFTTKTPDIFQIVVKIMNEVASLLKDGQDKEIKLSFEDFKTFLQFMSADKGKLAKALLQFLEVISKMRNLNDKDGKRDSVTLNIPDKEINLTYEQHEFSIKMTNVSAEFKYVIGPEKTNQPQNAVNTQAQQQSELQTA